MNITEQTHEENLEATRLTAKLIVSHSDDFDLEIARAANDLANRVRQHRNTNRKAARRIVAGFIEVKHDN